MAPFAQILDFSVRFSHLLTASQDQVAVSRSLEAYTDLDNTFSSTREYKLLGDLAETVEAGDQEAFSEKLYQFDQISKLDKWKTKLLLRVKDKIESAEEDFS